MRNFVLFNTKKVVLFPQNKVSHTKYDKLENIKKRILILEVTLGSRQYRHELLRFRYFESHFFYVSTLQLIYFQCHFLHNSDLSDSGPLSKLKSYKVHYKIILN